MSFAETLFQPPAGDYPGDAEGRMPASRAAVLVALFLACFALRWLMSLTWDVLWADGVIYLKTCQALEQGDFDNAFKSLGLNTYPAILLVLRRLGLEWSTAAVWWSVLMASLVVLPLYGWVRRQFDDQIAVLACILYALHPKLLGFSPLTIRDPTFWFLFLLTLYLLWRAVTELRWWLFIAGGISLTLACLTRTEGWLLLVPLALWPAGRFFSSAREGKLRLAAGSALALSMLPLLIVATNVTLLHNHSRWEFGHNQRIAHAVDLLGKLGRSEDGKTRNAPKAAAKQSRPKPPDNAASPEAPAKKPCPEREARKTELHNAPPVEAEPENRSTLRKAVELSGKVGSRLVKAFTYAYGLLIIVGLWSWRRIFLRREHQAIMVMNTLLLVAIGMRQSLDGIDVRYYLPIVIVGFSFMALGLLQVTGWVAGLLSKPLLVNFFAKGQKLIGVPLRIPFARVGEDGGTPRRRMAVGIGLLVVIAAVGSLNVFPVSRSTMYEHAHLGRWIHDRFGPGQKIIGTRRKQALVEYYAQGVVLSNSNSREYSPEPLLPLLEKKVPDVVLLWREWRHDYRWSTYAEKILERQEELGYREIPREQLPARCKNVRVLVRVDKLL